MKRGWFSALILVAVLVLPSNLFGMYSRVLQRFSDDITTQRRDITKITPELIQTYLGYIIRVRKEQTNPALFAPLEAALKQELTRREAPEKPPPPPERPALAAILDQEYAFFSDDRTTFFAQKKQPELINLLKTIEQYRLAPQEATAYDDLFKAIRTNLGIDALEQELGRVTVHFLNTKMLGELTGYIEKIDDYREATSNQIAFQDIYGYALERIVALQEPQEPAAPAVAGVLLAQANTKELWHGQRGNVVQVTVYNQMSAGGGGGASCGYQSLKNSILIMRAILNKRENGDIALVNDKQFIARYIGQPASPGIWRNLIINANYKKAVQWYIQNLLNERLLMSEDEIQGIPLPGDWPAYTLQEQASIFGKISGFYQTVISGMLSLDLAARFMERLATQASYSMRVDQRQIVDFVAGAHYPMDRDIGSARPLHLDIEAWAKNPENAQQYLKLQNLPLQIDINKQQRLRAYNENAARRGLRTLDVQAEWIKEDDIIKLVDLQKKEGLLQDMVGVGYTVIENVPMMRAPGQQAFSAYDDVREIAKEIKRNENYLHGFSLGLMGHYGGGQSHWISLVVNKVGGTLQFIVADSIPTNRYNIDLRHNNVIRILIEELTQ